MRRQRTLGVLMLLGVVAPLVVLLGTGCDTAGKVAQYGAPYRGPVRLDVKYGPDGDPTEISGETSGGVSSVMHYEKTENYPASEGGGVKKHVLATSDPTLVQQSYFQGVRGQSQQDATNFTLIAQTIVTSMQQLGTSFVSLAGQVQALKAETETERAERLQREQARDARIDRLIGVLEKSAPAGGG